MTFILKKYDKIKLSLLMTILVISSVFIGFTSECFDMETTVENSDNSYNQDKEVVEQGFVSAENDNQIVENKEEPSKNYYTELKNEQEKENIVKEDVKSYADEVFTVYDLNSKRDVTLNGFDLVCQIVRNEVGAAYKSGAKKGQTAFHKETIKAHAVAAYTYIKYNQARGIKASVGLNTDLSDALISYVEEVDGQAIYYNGQYICAVYTASTGGTTLSSKYCWGTNTPYLVSVESKHDSKSAQYSATNTMSAEKVKSIIESATDIKLSENPENWFYIAETVDGNYVNKLIIDGNSTCSVRGKNTSINGSVFREQIIGYSNLKSPAFTISYSNGEFIFTSYGYGHGVGMPSEGAQLYAINDNWSYDQILTHYYTGVNIK